MSKIKIMAHRGASHHAPENTAAAFKKAYDFNVDGIITNRPDVAMELTQKRG